jgi:hypothetical protein
MERFNLKKLNDIESKEQDHVEVSSRFAALEGLDAEVDLHKGINEFTRSCQPRSNLVKDENGELLNILYRVNDVRQIAIHTAELFVPDPSPCEVKIAIGKLERNKSPGTDQILAELIQIGGETLQSKIHKQNCLLEKVY